MFRTILNYNDSDKIYITCSGSHTIDVNEKKKTGEKKIDTGYDYIYKEVFDDKGVRHLVIAGRSNVYEKIQSFKDDVDIYKILSRYMNGDISILDKNKGFYADVSTMPKSFNEFHNKISEGQRIFGSLPTDFKAEFGNNINAFMQSIYDKSFGEKYNNYVKSKTSRNSNSFVNSQSSVGVNNDVSKVDNGGINNEK